MAVIITELSHFISLTFITILLTVIICQCHMTLHDPTGFYGSLNTIHSSHSDQIHLDIECMRIECMRVQGGGDLFAVKCIASYFIQKSFKINYNLKVLKIIIIFINSQENISQRIMPYIIKTNDFTLMTTIVLDSSENSLSK